VSARRRAVAVALKARDVRVRIIGGLLLILSMLVLVAGAARAEPARWAIAVHGGAGVIERKDLTPEAEAAYRAAMTQAVEKGSAIRCRAARRGCHEAVIRDRGRSPCVPGAARSSLPPGTSWTPRSWTARHARPRSPASPSSTHQPGPRGDGASPHVMMIGGRWVFPSVGIEMVALSWFFTERRWGQLVEVLTARVCRSRPAPPASRPRRSRP
jgi:beta-aspartyl-peptidase (threonine type)